MKNIGNWLVSESYILEFVLQKRKTEGLCSHRLFCIYVCMCVCVCVYIYIYMYLCIYVRMHMCVYVWMYVCVCACMYLSITHMSTSVFMWPWITNLKPVNRFLRNLVCTSYQLIHRSPSAWVTIPQPVNKFIAFLEAQHLFKQTSLVPVLSLKSPFHPQHPYLLNI